MGGPLPEPLLRELFPVDALLRPRYAAALERIGAPPLPDLASLHVDAAGYSPEVAEALGDPLYLGGGPLAGSGVVLSASQLSAPLVHPALGFAFEALRRVMARARDAISRLALHEAVILRVQHGSGRLASPSDLAEIARFEIGIETPTGLVGDALGVEERKAAFLSSDRLWLDDDWIRDTAALSRRVRDLLPVAGDLAPSRHGPGPFFTPAFGGAYVLEEGPRRIRVLCGERAASDGVDEKPGSARGREVVLGPLDARSAWKFLSRHRIARFDAAALRRDPAPLDAARHWLAVEHLAGRDPDALAGLDPSGIADAVARSDGAPAAFQELETVRRRLRARRGDVDTGDLSHDTLLRLVVPASTREPIRRFVRHLLAFFDAPNLERAWRDAPDLLFARLPSLRPAVRDAFGRWLERRERSSG